jgi:uncharacterized membrane protein YcjF (UPF0283 family)
VTSPDLNRILLCFFALILYLAAALTYCHVLTDLYQTDPFKAGTIICGGVLIFIIVVSLTREFIIATLTGDFGGVFRAPSNSNTT